MAQNWNVLGSTLVQFWNLLGYEHRSIHVYLQVNNGSKLNFIGDSTFVQNWNFVGDKQWTTTEIYWELILVQPEVYNDQHWSKTTIYWAINIGPKFKFTWGSTLAQNRNFLEVDTDTNMKTRESTLVPNSNLLGNHQLPKIEIYCGLTLNQNWNLLGYKYRSKPWPKAKINWRVHIDSKVKSTRH